MGFIDIFFPKKCLECGKEDVYLCRSCIEKVAFLKQVCIRCERPSIDGMTHVKCQKKLDLDRCFSLWVYQGVIRKAIVKLKYKFAYEISLELANHFVHFLGKKDIIFPQNVILTPIPLHRRRKNWRGFNQAEEMGKIVSERLGWKFYPDILLRKKLNFPQTELKEDQRKGNIRGVFCLNPRYDIQNTLNTILIFDDVLTTGATLKEAGKVLKRNGARKVLGLTMAR